MQEAGLSPDAIGIAIRARRASTVSSYDSRLGKFFGWAREADVNPMEASIGYISDFLMYLFNSGLQVVTIKHYRSAISSIHRGFTDGSTVGTNEAISCLIKGMFHTRPTVRRLAPTWSINEVLVALAKPPYEPMGTISLQQLTMKTVFLVAAASARRRSTIHALTVKDGFLRFSASGVTLLPDPMFLSEEPNSYFHARTNISEENVAGISH